MDDHASSVPGVGAEPQGPRFTRTSSGNVSRELHSLFSMPLNRLDGHDNFCLHRGWGFELDPKHWTSWTCLLPWNQNAVYFISGSVGESSHTLECQSFKHRSSD